MMSPKSAKADLGGEPEGHFAGKGYDTPIYGVAGPEGSRRGHEGNPPAERDLRQMVVLIGARATEARPAMTTTVVAEHTPSHASAGIIETTIPARLDRLRWGRFHTLVVVALGITGVLTGLEVTLAGAVSPALKESPQLRFSNADVGLVSSAYLAGAVMGALFFGWLTDRLGRKRLFFITLVVYLLATAATALSWNIWSFALFRFLTGAGIGGEYTAINSAIQELVPARYRGWTDLVINGSFWVGAAVGAAASIVLLDPAVLAPDVGWRLAFLIGAVLGLIIFLMRLWLPESPRWLMTDGRVEDANKVLDQIEREFRARGHRFEAKPLAVIRLRIRRFTPRGSRQDAFSYRAQAHLGRLKPDGGAGVLLQRHFLHLCAGADRLLRYTRRSCGLVSVAVRGRKLPRTGVRCRLRSDF